MKLYDKYLKAQHALSEKDFNEVINTFPPYEFTEFNDDTIGEKYELAEVLINDILLKWNSVYVEEVDYDDKSFILADVEFLKDLYEINEFFKGYWDIKNFNEIERELLEYEKDERLESEREKFIDELRLMSLDKFEKLMQYVNEKRTSNSNS